MESTASSDVKAAEEYQNRLRSYVADQDPLEMQREAPGILSKLISDVPEDLLTRCPANGKWSICGILAHLAEDELVSSWRYRQMIENSGCALSGFDQDHWARLGRYQSWKPAEALEMFRLLREANLRMLSSLTPEELQCGGVHVERGPMTVADLVRHMAGHDQNHIDQIRRVLEAFQRA